MPRCTLQCPSACSKPPPSYVSTGDPPTLTGSFCSVSYWVAAPFLWVLVCARVCLCLPRLESLFPPFLWQSHNQILLVFKVRFPGDSQALCRVPGLGSLMWGSKPSQYWENVFVIIVLQFVGHPLGKYEIWFYHGSAPPTISLQLLLCLWMWGRFQCPSVDGCSTASFDFDALPGGDEHMSFCSAILNQKLIH